MYKDHEHFVEMTKVQSYVGSMAFDVFIDEDIDNPEYYRSVINTFNKAAEGDVINIFINTGGGQDRTTSSIIHAMDNCKANIVGHLSGSVCSNGTIIALHCHNWTLAEDLVFMCHNGIAGFHGSAEKVKKRHDFYQEQNRKVIFREYEGFLSEEECEEIITHGEEFWFDKDETVERLENFVKYHQEKSEQKLNAQREAQFEEEDAFVEKGISMLEKEGSVSKEDIEKFKLVSDKLNKLYKTGEIFGDSIPCTNKSCSEDDTGSKDLPLASFSVKKEISPQDTFEEDTCGYMLPVKDVFGETWKLNIDLDEDGDIESLELEYEGLEKEYYIISKLALEDMDKEELKSLAERFEISFPHNIGKQTLAKKIVDHFECEVLDYLS